MATAKRDLTDPRVQGPHVIDLREDVISIDEVARRLSVPKTTLYGWRYKGKGPRSHRVGKHLRYRWSDVLAWLDALD
ncbi:MAG: helix-turn-helix domain-containing protein [Actinobacteria bacterium]|nr:helix-turn-helix domain-containing protein [Actinomycetota bacterium]